MSGLARIAIFLGVLGAAFGGAAAIGRAVGPLERDVAEAEHTEPAAQAAAHGTAAPIPDEPVGLSLAANGFRFVAPQTRFSPSEARPFTFRIAGAHDFDVVHERRMHLIVVRRDLTHFQHLHPARRADGSWSVELSLPAPGLYRAFADFSAGGERTVLGLDLFAPGEWTWGRPAAHGTQPYRVTMRRNDDALAFRVTRDGRPARIDPYLGARGHLVVLRVGDLAYIHTHADESELAFEAHLPSKGAYRAFLQYKAGGAVRTASFALEER